MFRLGGCVWGAKYSVQSFKVFLLKLGVSFRKILAFQLSGLWARRRVDGSAEECLLLRNGRFDMLVLFERGHASTSNDLTIPALSVQITYIMQYALH